MALPSTDEMAELQRLSEKYQPELEGPLIGDKLPMNDLVAEYAQADPTYITKTQRLAVSYLSYRRVKGDGQCGWRGVVFGYFENVFKSRDYGFVQQEFVRIQSFEETMKMAGIAYDVLEAFFEETWELFGQILKSFEDSSINDTLITTVMNDESKSNAIVYHFKMMTSAYMALRPDDFQPWLEMPLDVYRQTRIDPTLQEIDDIGLTALARGVIAPAKLAVQVLYLDRSAGDEVTPHEFVDHASEWPAIRLLYRPGHYDLIYKHDETYKVFLASHVPYADNFNYINSNPVEDQLYSYVFPDAYLGSAVRNYNAQPSESEYNYANQAQYHISHGFTSQNYARPSLHPPLVLPLDYSGFHNSVHYTPSPESYSDFQTMPPTTLEPPNTHTLPIRASNSEPQIRHTEYSSAIRGPRRVPHTTMPLDRSSFSALSQDRAHFTHQDFTPQMWDGSP